MKDKKKTSRIINTLSLLATAVIATNLIGAAGTWSNPITNNTSGYFAQVIDASPFTEEAPPTQEIPLTGETTEEVAEPEQGPVTETGPCGQIRSNEQIADYPLTTVSDTCAQATVSAGGIAFEYIPNSFNFPIKEFSAGAQHSFSNDYEETEETDVETGPEDILTLHDFRNNGGFTVTITSSGFESSTGEIPLKNLYVAATYPEDDDFDALDINLNGTQTGGVEYAAGSKGPQDVTASAFTEAGTNLPESYAVSFDENEDGAPDIVELMNTASSHVGRFSQALNFYLQIPANQPAGAYQVKFTVDLIY